MKRTGCSDSGAGIRVALQRALVLVLLLGGTGCGFNLGSVETNVVNAGPPISINTPANGYSTTAPTVSVAGHVNRQDGTFPSGVVSWSNDSSSGNTLVRCDFLCCFIVCTGSWQADVPINVGANTITVTYEGASVSVTVTRIPMSVISGRVFMQSTNAGLASPDIYVTLTENVAGSFPIGASLDQSGNYTYTGVLDGSYTFSPHLPPPESSSCLAFTPASRTVVVAATDVVAQDFAAAPASPCFLIRGQVTATTGTGVMNIKVFIRNSGGGSNYRFTDANGFYEFHYLLPDTYTITPENCQYGNCSTFIPTSATVTVTNTNVTGKDFSL